MNVLKFDIGNILTRTESAKCSYGDDGSYKGSRVKLIRKGDDFAEVYFIDGTLRNRSYIFTDGWLEGWAKLSDSIDEEQAFRESHGIIENQTG